MKPTNEAIEAALPYAHTAGVTMRNYILGILTAAYAAQFQSEEYAGLIERLKTLACELASVNDAVGEKFVEINEAADAIEALLAERDALNFELAARKEWPQARAEMLDELAKVRAERDALLARLAPVDDEALVKIGASAMAAKEYDQEHYPWESLKPNEQNEYIVFYRAAFAAVRPHIEAAERERCAKKIEPTGPRPCDCESCDCGNKDDAERVAAWDEAMANAAAIRSGK